MVHDYGVASLEIDPKIKIEDSYYRDNSYYICWVGLMRSLCGVRWELSDSLMIGKRNA